MALVVAGTAHMAQAQEGGSKEPVHLGKVSIGGDDVGGGESYKAEPESPKYTAPLVDTPRSVTIVTEQVMEDMGSTTLVDALRTVPGITMAMGEGGQPFADRPFIRGYESTSGLLVDGMRDSSAQSRDVFNLEQIEVVKGSSGAFAGRGAPGGSVNLVTKTAKDRDFISGRAQYGNADQARLTADLNHVVSEDFAFRVNALWQDADVPGRDAVYDDRWGIAPTFTIGLNGPTRFTASYVHYEGHALMDYGHPLDPVTGMPVEGIDPDNFYGLVNRDFHNTKLDSGYVEIEHDFSERVSLRNITRYSHSVNDYIATNPDDSQGNVPNGLVFRNVKSNNSRNETIVNQTDLTASFDTGGLKHNLSAGIEYSHERTVRATYSVDLSGPGGVAIPRGGCDLFGTGASSDYNCTDLYNPDPFDPWSGSISLNATTTTKAGSWGAYVFDTIDITDRLLLNVGLRWDDFSTETSTGLSNDSDFLTYQAGLVYKPTEHSSVYFSYGTSVSPSGVTVGDGSENISTTNEDLKPQHGRNIELGTKWELFGDRLALNAALFRTEVKNVHVAVEPGRGGAQEAIGKQRVQGVELSATGQITDAWSIFAGYSYLDSKILEAGPINAGDEGNLLPNTPKHSFNLWTTYAITPQATIGGGVTHMSKRYGNTANNRSVEGFWRVDLMASYDINEHVGLQLNVQNLTNERYYDRVYTTHMATIAPGRSITGSVRLMF
jgi:catecholate siderophore receptor